MQKRNFLNENISRNKHTVSVVLFLWSLRETCVCVSALLYVCTRSVQEITIGWIQLKPMNNKPLIIKNS